MWLLSIFQRLDVIATAIEEFQSCVVAAEGCEGLRNARLLEGHPIPVAAFASDYKLNAAGRAATRPTPL